ncbi:hypothetical protein [Solimonas marina]|uniref:Uncharacterized protein n=1 Tax=Solimonas marina TaxID=2714601 RepID=A0A969WB84_9GAMM|nr:hypothetical protein [Solimonas marina]NKF23353.1 hypothetical protein [Solimonas marina]
MKFSIQVTSGGEVVFSGHSQKNRPVYYGAPPETGLWRVSIPKFEDFVAGKLLAMSFGDSIDEFLFGFEIGELEEWGMWFTSMSNYMSYRPKNKTFISVGQLDWKVVKHLSTSEQLKMLGDTLISSIERIATAKRKPKDFDHMALAQTVRGILHSCEPSLVEASA